MRGWASVRGTGDAPGSPQARRTSTTPTDGTTRILTAAVPGDRRRETGRDDGPGPERAVTGRPQGPGLGPERSRAPPRTRSPGGHESRPDRVGHTRLPTKGPTSGGGGRRLLVHVELDLVGGVAPRERAHLDLNDLRVRLEKLEGVPLAQQDQVARTEGHVPEPVPLDGVEAHPQPSPLADEDLVPGGRGRRGLVHVVVGADVGAGVAREEDDLQRQL